MSRLDLSRRDFLKLSGYGLMGMVLPAVFLPQVQQDDFSNLQGRILDRTAWSYEAPDLKSTRRKLYWHDLVLPIKNTAISEDEDSYNRVWYELEEGGYLFSSSIQPVRTLLNQPQQLSLKGALGEVSVPFTDAHVEPDLDSKVLYRLYYETVHWVKRSGISPADGKVWYYLLDDKKNQNYCVPAEHIRLLSDSELAPISEHVPEKEKRVEVRLKDQAVLAYESGTLVFATLASTGGRLQSGKYITPSGDFITFHKRPTLHMAAGDIAASGFDLPGVPWVLYITKSGISFHGTYWHNGFGRPRSHGCINLTHQAAKWLYRWTRPTVSPDKELAYGYVGTKVEIKL